MTITKTTNKYKATFEVPAMVRIEIEVDADNQQDGLINAHDLITQASVTQAKVVSMSLDRATNTAFERLEFASDALPAVDLMPTTQECPHSGQTVSTSTEINTEPGPSAASELPPGPLDIRGHYRVEFFTGKDQVGEPVQVVGKLAFPEARSTAEGVLLAGCIHGSARVFDEFSTVVLRTMAPRGGYEVHGFQGNASPDAVPDISSDRLFTWIPSLKEAKKTALDLLGRADIKMVRIVDYTNRQTGPSLVREIR